MKSVSSATWILVGLLVVAFALDLSGFNALMPNGGSFFLGSIFVIGFLIGGAALLRFGLIRRPFRRLGAWVTIVLLYFSFFAIRVAAFQDEQYQPSLLFLLCLIGAFRILRAESKTPRVAPPSLREGTADEPPPDTGAPSAPKALATSQSVESSPAPSLSPTNSPPIPAPVHGKVWPLVILALLLVAAIILEVRVPSASLKFSNLGIILGGMLAGASIRFLYSGCWHFEGSRFGPGIASLFRGLGCIGIVILIHSLPQASLDLGRILSLWDGEATVGFFIAAVAGYAMASWLGEPKMGKTTSQLLMVGASLVLGMIFLGIWLDQLNRSKPAEKPKATSGRWNVETHEGVEFVSDQEVMASYGFQGFEIHDEIRGFRHPGVAMAWIVGDTGIFINQVEIGLRHPIIERHGTSYIAAVDLAKVVEPIITPSRIGSRADYDFVTISLGDGDPLDSSATRRSTFLEEFESALTEAFTSRGITVAFTDTFAGSSMAGTTKGQTAFLDLELITVAPDTPGSLFTQAVVSPDAASNSRDLRVSIRDLETITLAIGIHSHLMDFDPEKQRVEYAEDGVAASLEGPMIRVAIKDSKLFQTLPEDLSNDSANRLAQAIADGFVRWRSALKLPGPTSVP